ncbi:hypothetical protein BHE74_00036166 [Ensete ventricosum]|nr:hypothetical protein GW17_00021309 [Ensete ventricosum]RWW57072.1 hypothetical protein BHE74_00036166 [Ensete ventricosum]
MVGLRKYHGRPIAARIDCSAVMLPSRLTRKLIRPFRLPHTCCNFRHYTFSGVRRKISVNFKPSPKI